MQISNEIIADIFQIRNMLLINYSIFFSLIFNFLKFEINFSLISNEIIKSIVV
jgi:hypothetical protein